MVEIVKMMDETRERNDMLSALVDLSATFSSSLALDELLDAALEMIVALTGFESGDVLLLDDDQHYLTLRASSNPSQHDTKETLRIGKGEGISGRVWQTGKSAVTHDYRADPRRLNDSIDVQTLVGVPLVSKGKVIGVLALFDRAERRVSEQDLELMVAIGLQLGVAIENARLYELALTRARTAAKLSLLGTKLTASLNVAETLDLICQQALEIFGADGVYVWVQEEDDLVGTAAIGRGSEQFVATRINIDDPITIGARVVRERQTLIVNDATQAQANQELVALLGCQSLLGTPLIREEQPVGSIMLVSTEDPHYFSEADVGAANLFGAHAALAVSNARLFEKTTHQLRQLQLVQEVSRDVTSYLDIDLLLAAVAERVWSAFGFYAVSIIVREGEELVPRSMLLRGESVVDASRTVQPLPQDGIIGTAIEKGRPILASDVSQEPAYRPAKMLPDTKAELTVPLMLAGEVLGALDVQSDRRGGLTEADLELMEPLAAQIAISLSNAELFGAVRDYTSELEMHIDERTQRIRKQQERTDAILRSVGDGVVVVDLDEQIVLTNPVADDLLDGQGSNSLRGEQLREFILDLASGDQSDQTRRLDLDSMTLQAHASRLIEAGQVQGTVIVLHDITHIQEVDQLKSDFVSTVSHELRTPLANLKLYLKLLQDGKMDQQERYIETMRQEAGRLEHLIDNLLDLSHLESIKATSKTYRSTDLNELVRLVVANHEPQAQDKSIIIQTSLDNTLPAVFGDRNQLIQVLMNLVANAMAYTPEGGDVWLRSATETTSDGVQVAIIVEDSGIGISSDELDRIFERFYRGKNTNILNVSGSGLGLAIVREIVEMHAGEISVNSAVGVGSTFKLTLPSSDAAVDALSG